MGSMKELAAIVQQHFAKQPLASYGDADSILETLFWLYTENNNLDNEAVKQQFARLREYLNLPAKEYDEVFYIVSSLCLEHGKQAFRAGFSMAMDLMQEVIET